MLDGLDGVNWPALRHAHGAATGVPDLLRALAAGDAGRRDAALQALRLALCDQGTVCEAAAAVIPFLVELAARAGVPGRGEVLCLLGLVARGRPWHADHDPGRRGEVARELRWAEAVRAAVRQALPGVLPLLRDGDPTVRRGAALVAACAPADAGASRPALRAALSVEPGALERATLGLSLAVLGELEPGAFEVTSPAPPPLPVARVAALAAATAGGAFPPDDALEALLVLALGFTALVAERLDELAAP